MKLTEKGMTFERLDDHRERAHKEKFDTDTSRFIVLSDAHKWDRGNQDFFQHSEPAYIAALDHYFDNGFKLVLLGDIEEGAGDRFQHVLKEYPRTFFSEKRFLAENRYIRVYGNHDHDWKKDDFREILAEAMGAPSVEVCPAVLLGDQIIVVHGHEGDLFSDEFHGFTQAILRLFKKPAEMLFGGPSAAENSRIRSTRAKLLYRWGEQNRMIVIAGHTHYAYFESVSLTRRLHDKIRKFEDSVKAGPQAGFEKEYHDLDQDRKFMVAQDKFWKKDQSLPKGSLPLYFNTGCCKYKYALTGIEISGGEIKLVKWEAPPGSLPERTVLGSRRLADILIRLKP